MAARGRAGRRVDPSSTEAAAQGQTVVAAIGRRGVDDCYPASRLRRDARVDDPAASPTSPSVGAPRCRDAWGRAERSRRGTTALRRFRPAVACRTWTLRASPAWQSGPGVVRLQDARRRSPCPAPRPARCLPGGPRRVRRRRSRHRVTPSTACWRSPGGPRSAAPARPSPLWAALAALTDQGLAPGSVC